MSTLDTLGLTSGKTIEVTDARGDTRETQAAQLSYTYVFDGKAQYDRFVKNVRTAGLDDAYTVSSADVQPYEASLVPLDNLANFAKTLLGVGAGAAASFPVSNSLRSSQVEAQAEQQQQQRAQFGRDIQPPSGSAQGGSSQDGLPNAPQKGNGAPQQWGHATQMVSKVNSTVNWATIGWMLLIGIGLTLLASLVAAVFVMRYEPLQILADRS